MKLARSRILVVEDDPAILRGLLDVLTFNGYEAAGVADGPEGLATALNGNFDLILLDVMLPGLDGFSICQGIRAKKPGQGILMLTAKGAEDDVVTGFSAGADDYVTKPFSLRELMVRVEAVLRRTGRGHDDLPFEVAGMIFDPANLVVSREGRQLELTRREMDIVAHLLRHRDRIVSKKELLVEVWRYADADIETRTVDIHVIKLRKKLSELVGDTLVIRTMRGEGYRLEAEP